MNLTRNLIFKLLFIFLIASGFNSFAGTVQTSNQNTLKLAILSLASPAKIYKQWQPFADYLSAKTDKQVEIVVPRGFKKIKKAIEDKSVDLFYVNSHIMYRLHKDGNAIPVAQVENLNHSVMTKSLIFVRKDSGLNSLPDLRGKKMGFVSPMGAGGYIAPRAAFYSNGVNVKEEIEEVFTKNLTSSIHKVLLGDLQAATMCGISYQLMSRKIDTGDLKIIAESDPFPENAFGARSGLSEEVLSKVTSVIVDMDSDTEGRKILDDMKGMKINRFVAYNEDTEKVTHALLQKGKFGL